MRETPNNEAIIVEYGFLDSSGDDVYQIKNDWKKYAEAVVKALADYSKVPYIGPLKSDAYIVKSGDTLWSIAKKYNLSVNELKDINNLKSNALSIGQSLIVSPKEKETISGDNVYTVKSGDNLYSIAQKYNTTVSNLKSLNNLTNNNLSIGQKLLVKSNKMDDTTNKYVVKSGDNLYAISKLYGVSVNDLKTVNNLNSDVLKIGQELIIPTETKTYTVKSGDTLYSISRKFNTTVTKLIDLNNLSTNILSVGQKLLVP